jgi:hypothetical protein
MKIALVACAKRKLEELAPAEKMYTSPLFRKAKQHAEEGFDQWFILSAKFGLLKPSDIISPYDLTLKDLPKGARREWANMVAQAVRSECSGDAEIHILGGEAYSHPLSELLSEAGFNVKLPLHGLSLGRQLQWYDGRRREKMIAQHLDRFYDLLARLQSGGASIPFSECSGKSPIPPRGIYIFSEPGEDRLTGACSRVVRVGTHGVSVGSRSTLWGRLKSHLGTSNGLGNHRSSVFRLHVGAAIRNRDNPEPHESWGQGSTTSAAAKELELELEASVTEYMRSLRVYWLCVPDEASPQSDRAILERNLVALLSNRYHPVDPPSPQWLGLVSPRWEIRESGLWNINYTGDYFDQDVLNLFEFFVEATLEPSKLPSASVASQFLKSGHQPLLLDIDTPETTWTNS